MYTSLIKPVLDRTAAAVGMILLSPLFLATTLAFLSGRQFPMIFKQQRTGKAGRPFTLYKFRTLVTNDGLPLQERKFWLGNFLRGTTLDELPQLVNVLKGEMSIVGPRPLPVEYGSLYTPKQNRRHDVLPGITGLAQVNGKNDLAWSQKFELDVYYVDHLSLMLDITILLKTISVLFSGKMDTSLAEEKFTG